MNPDGYALGLACPPLTQAQADLAAALLIAHDNSIAA